MFAVLNVVTGVTWLEKNKLALRVVRSVKSKKNHKNEQKEAYSLFGKKERWTQMALGRRVEGLRIEQRVCPIGCFSGVRVLGLSEFAVGAPAQCRGFPRPEPDWLELCFLLYGRVKEVQHSMRFEGRNRGDSFLCDHDGCMDMGIVMLDAAIYRGAAWHRSFNVPVLWIDYECSSGKTDMLQHVSMMRKRHQHLGHLPYMAKCEPLRGQSPRHHVIKHNHANRHFYWCLSDSIGRLFWFSQVKSDLEEMFQSAQMG